MKNRISVIIPTRNRGPILKSTLTHMECLKFPSLETNFIIVDNASTDNTKEIITSFTNRLQIQYILEERLGKNHALNKALKCESLGDIIVFTDDDVTPNKDWLVAINDVNLRWPSYSIFGGKIYVLWPQKKLPSWVDDAYIRGFGFTEHDYAAKEKEYEEFYAVPFGPNYWIRKKILSDGFQFNVEIGPHPTNRILGDETTLLRKMKIKGYGILYVPKAVVGHRIEKNALTEKYIHRRAYQFGRSYPYSWELPRKKIFDKHPVVWQLIQILAIINSFIRVITGFLHINERKRVTLSVRRVYRFAAHLETFKFVIFKKS